MTRETLLEESRGLVRLVRMNRPAAKNAFDNRMYNQLADAIGEADADPGVRVLVLTGVGDAFSAGQDLAEMSAEAPTDGGPIGFERLLDAVLACAKPIVAAVNGVAVGIGMTLLPHLDLVYVARRAKLRVPFTALGVTPEAGASLTFPALFGTQRAMEILLSGRFVGAEEAVALGLALEVIDDERVLDVAIAKAEELAKLPPLAVQATKRLVRAATNEALASVRARENESLALRIRSSESREAVRAFFEKRSPDFGKLPDA